MKTALLVQGGWTGHQPEEMADLLAAQLRQNNFSATISDSLDAFKDPKLAELDLIVPIWTMGTITKEQLNPLLAAVQSGVGIAGVHGGMADAFRNEPEYQFMVGGQWVAHPGGDGVNYTVHVNGSGNPITEGVKDFAVSSEQYYMHIDPAINVLATTNFGDVIMPVAWTKYYGKGRVFYLSLGHQVNVIEQPEALTMITRGMLWAANRESPN
jgi:type 1 glutamine amidotransferase